LTEVGMGPDTNLEQQVAAAGGLALQAHDLAFLDAGRHFHLDFTAVELDVDRTAKGRPLEGNRHFGFDLGGWLWPAAATTASSPTKNFAHAPEAKQLAEALGHFGVHLGEVAGGPTPVERLSAGVGGSDGETAVRTNEAETIVLGAFGLIAEDVVGFLHFLEA